MSTNTTFLKRFTLMLSGEDSPDLVIEGAPPKGLPHERFLLGEKVALAPILLLSQSTQTIGMHELVACLQPVHFHATRDHLILIQQDQMHLTREESSQLLHAALPYIEADFQCPILHEGIDDWFIQAGPFAGLETHSIEQAHGRNIDWWMPRDGKEDGVAKRWRKLQNEIQMLWHQDPVNEKRIEKGLLPINSLWISGIGSLADVKTPMLFNSIQTLYGVHPLLIGLGKYLTISSQEQVDPDHLANGFAWLNDPEEIWPMLRNALFDGRLDEIEMIDFPHGVIRHRTIRARDLLSRSWKFWKKPELLSWQTLSQLT